ncbi:putative Ig domain-containing protein [Chitinophaga sp. XS-30]|uniref:putative Ig domain-containing protein n=1 Tax=Chitinophaga sp. XS-30 TaxID=2604421 RepID=UPI0011DE3E27|nr:putative Ig domain-containing protein [Chitinophaga sp. XS-30]QEH42592.1 T9SS type A sorting domain-containing protein [Chitinophaga sp. XS-30]
MKRFLHLLLLLPLWLLSGTAGAQTTLDPSDPIVIYNSSNPPVEPQWGTIGKWVKTNRMSWTTTSYKAYIYKGMCFRLKFPKTYQHGVSDGKKYPVYLFFHGLGEKGTIYDNEFQLLHGGKKFSDLVDNGTFDGFLIYPQSKGLWGNSEYDNVKELLDSMATFTKADLDRVYVNGLSSGGQGTWAWTMRYPQLTAASLPMSAASLDYINSINTYKFLPMWLFQGGQDGNPAPYTTDQVVAAINNAGGNLKFSFYPTATHDSWTRAWQEADFVPFMLRANRLKPWPLHGDSLICPGTSVTIGISPGFSNYEWRKDGVAIPGNTNQVVVNTPGAYSVRALSNHGWTGWSPVPLNIAYKPNTSAPVITTSGLASNVIPAPDGSTSVNLTVPAGLEQYEWKRAGYAPVIGTGNSITASTPGKYTVRVLAADSCISESSDTFLIVNANGINGPDAISGLIVSGFTQTSVTLSWAQSQAPAHNEKFFEVYRGTQPGGPYVLVAKVAADATGYTDEGLFPDSSYYYKVRPVNDNAAAPVSAEVKGTTTADNATPAAPTGLAASYITTNSFIISWNAATDDAGIGGYDVYVNGALQDSTGAATLRDTITGLTANTPNTVYIKAKDVTGKVSTASSQLTVVTKRGQLAYKYYKYSGTWNSLPNFANLTPTETGRSATPDISARPNGVTTKYGFLWTGYIHIPVAGTYIFETNSDDGSKLYFNMPYSHSATATVNNDGNHGAQYRSGTVTVAEAGVYPIAVTFYQGTGGHSLGVYWTNAAVGATTRQLIPAQYYMDDPGVTGTNPAAPTTLAASTVNHSKISLTWTDNSNNETGFEIYRGLSAAGTFEIVATAAANATAFTDSLLDASTTYYYKVRAIGAAGESAYGNTANATTNPLPTPPATPFNLSATPLSVSAISLTWSDTANNESGFEIYRSFAPSGFTLLHTIGAVTNGTGAYTDSTLVANTLAYYRIRAIGEGGTSGYAAYDSARTLTNPPVISPISSQTVRYGTTVNIPVVATDEDNDPITYSLLNAPAFISVSAAPGNVHLVVSPASNEQGTYNNIGVIAKDIYDGADTAYFDLVVNDNYAPVITPMEAFNVNEGASDTVKITVTDQNPGESFTWSAIDLPAFVTLSSQNDTALLVIEPGYSASGTYNIKVGVTDNRGGITEHTFTLNVTDMPTPDYKLFLNFRLNQDAPAPWNNIADKVTNNLLNENGEVTTVGLEFTDWWWAAGVEGATTYNNSGVYPDAVISQYIYFGTLEGFFSGATTMNGKLTGLETNRPYSIRFFSSSKWWAPQPDNGSTVFTINGVSKTLYAHNNSSNTVIFENLMADTNGEISFVLSLPPGGQVGYLNAMEVNAGGAGTPPVNRKPEITAIADKSVQSGTTTSIPISATDPDGDVLTYSTENLPSFVTLVQSQGNVSLTVAPGLTDEGVYNDIRVIATDAGSLSDTASFNLEVTSAPPPTADYKLMLNFRLNADAPAPWNNIAEKETNDLKDEDGNTTSVSLIFDSWWWASGVEGATTYNNSGVYPDAVISQYMYFGSLPGFFNGALTMPGKLTGLDATKSYSIKFFSSSKWWAPQPDNGSTIFTINGVSKTLYSHNNSTNTVEFTNLTPDTNGEISFVLSLPEGGQVGYLNAMEVTAGEGGPVEPPVNRAPVISAIGNQAVQAGTTGSIQISATDPDGDMLTYSTENLPSFVTLVQSQGNVSLSVAPGLADEGVYSGLRVIAKDQGDLADTATFDLEITGTPPPAPDYKLMLNFRLNADAPAPWNNIAEKVTNNLKDDQGQTTGVSLVFDSWWWAAGIEGATTYNNSGVYPDAVISQYMYFGSLPGFFNGALTMPGKLTGLDAAKTYSIKFFSSSKWWAPQPDNGSTVFTIGGVSQTLYAHNNSANTIEFTDLVPDENGEISFVLSLPEGGQVGYLNAMEVNATSGEQLDNNALMISSPTQATKADPLSAENDGIRMLAYPNPFSNLLAVDVELKRAGNVKLEIVDMTGRLVYTENRSDMPAGKSTIRLTTGSYIHASGIYLLRLVQADGTAKTIKILRK